MKIYWIGAVVLGCCLAVAAQDNKAADEAPLPTTDAPHATVEGCLSQPKAGGKFVLSRMTGKRYHLDAKKGKLDGLIGKEIRVYGEVMGDDDPEVSTPTEPGERIIVYKVSKLDDSCLNGASGAPGSPNGAVGH